MPVTNVAKVETPSAAKPVIVANATKSTPIIPTLSLFSIGSLFKSTTASDTETIDTARAEETPVLDWFKSNEKPSTFPANIPLPPRRG